MTGLPLLLMLIFGAVKARRPFFLVKEPSSVVIVVLFLFFKIYSNDLAADDMVTWYNCTKREKQILARTRKIHEHLHLYQ